MTEQNELINGWHCRWTHCEPNGHGGWHWCSLCVGSIFDQVHSPSRQTSSSSHGGSQINGSLLFLLRKQTPVFGSHNSQSDAHGLSFFCQTKQRQKVKYSIILFSSYIYKSAVTDTIQMEPYRKLDWRPSFHNHNHIRTRRMIQRHNPKRDRFHLESMPVQNILKYNYENRIRSVLFNVDLPEQKNELFNLFVSIRTWSGTCDQEKKSPVNLRQSR